MHWFFYAVSKIIIYNEKAEILKYTEILSWGDTSNLTILCNMDNESVCEPYIRLFWNMYIMYPESAQNLYFCDDLCFSVIHEICISV